MCLSKSPLLRTICATLLMISFSSCANKSSRINEVFNAKYGNFQSEGTQHFSILNDLQLSHSFGKVATELHFRKLFKNNRQISFRLYAGAFVYNNTNTTFFSFGLDRPNDYMFDYNLLGRSETTGIYSQQYVYGEGGFKSKLETYGCFFLETSNRIILLY